MTTLNSTLALALFLLVVAGCSETRTSEGAAETAAVTTSNARWDKGATAVTDGIPPGADDGQPLSEEKPDQEHST